MRWGSEAPLIGLSELGELRVDELLGVELCGLFSQMARLLPEFFRPAGEAAATTA